MALAQVQDAVNAVNCSLQELEPNNVPNLGP
jgi:hypothetical protein